ncbi:hypothetical protein HAP48_0042790 [Bradyrhizobium septentrionale]|uniref:Uncharacterized protein n=1 Tax=Bradyrhizobium septentrionale TaxID=1404411 RepID=A0A974A383_9BRAD|nr:hypothetical protein [Bradyrhizobium septentrionale]UGY15186.1 hypothetical protein HAP48_0042790 [Bradyrhizobium septentrionale]
MTTKAISAVLADTRSPAAQKAFINAFADAPLIPLEEQIADLEARLDAMVLKAETGAQWAEICRIERNEMIPLLRQKAVPVDPMRKTASSIEHGTKFSKSQVQWIMDHDWAVRSLMGAVVVIDRFTYNGSAYAEYFVWAGTFNELRDWAGY